MIGDARKFFSTESCYFSRALLVNRRSLAYAVICRFRIDNICGNTFFYIVKIQTEKNCNIRMTAIKVVSKFYVKQVDCQVQGTNLKLASFSYVTWK